MHWEPASQWTWKIENATEWEHVTRTLINLRQWALSPIASRQCALPVRNSGRVHVRKVKWLSARRTIGLSGHLNAVLSPLTPPQPQWHLPSVNGLTKRTCTTLLSYWLASWVRAGMRTHNRQVNVNWQSANKNKAMLKVCIEGIEALKLPLVPLALR